MRNFTPSELSSLPDRELDAVVAEVVEGWIWLNVPPDAHGENAGRALVSPHFERAIIRNEIDWPKKGKVGELAYVSRYSTDPAASHELKQEMRKRGWYFSQDDVLRMVEDRLTRLTAARVYTYNYSVNKVASSASELRVIAEAAVLAVQEEKE